MESVNNQIKKFKFLITGGAGFIGSHLVEYLVKSEAKHVRVLDNLSTGSKENLSHLSHHSNLEIIEGDIRDVETCNMAVVDMDFVLHQAALGSVPRSIKDPQTTHDVNVNGFFNILMAIKNAGTVKRLVYAASSSTYGDSQKLPKQEDTIGKPLSPYAVTKYVNELYADIFWKTYNIESIGLRYFNVFGPRQNPNGPYAAVIPLFMQSSKDGKPPIIHGDGEQTRDFTFVQNVVHANILSCFSNHLDNNYVFNIACGERISLNDLWQTLQSVSGNHIDPIYTEPRKGDVKHSLADISKAEKYLNYKPQVKMTEGLEITWNWFKDQ